MTNGAIYSSHLLVPIDLSLFDDFRRRLASTFVYIHLSILPSMGGGGGKGASVGKFGLNCELIVKTLR